VCMQLLRVFNSRASLHFCPPIAVHLQRPAHHIVLALVDLLQLALGQVLRTMRRRQQRGELRELIAAKT